MTAENAFEKLMKQEKVAVREFKYGIVVALDALGISNYRVSEAKEYLQKRDFVLKFSKELIIPYLKTVHPKYGKSINGPETYSFGDTMILAWEMSAPTETQEAAFLVADFVRSLFYSALLSRILLRGSIALGAYTSDAGGIIGPAVADAAAWYEEANWIGVVATPTLGICLETASGLKLADTETLLLPRYIKYEVPLRSGRKYLMWALAWPYEYWCQTGSSARSQFAVTLEPTTDSDYLNLAIPYGAETKYSNAFEFCEYFAEHATQVKPKDKLKVYADFLAEKSNEVKRQP